MNKFSTVATASALLVAGVIQAQSASLTVEYEGVSYELEASVTDHDTDYAALEAAPWWGNESLAIGLAGAVELSLGTQTGTAEDFPDRGAYFLWSQTNESASQNGYVAFFDSTLGVISCAEAVNTCPEGEAWTPYNFEAVLYVLVGTGLPAASSAAPQTLRPVKYTSAPDLIPSNVPTCSGSKFVSGVQVIGNGGIKWYVEHSKKDECFDVDVTVLPEGVSAKEMAEVLAALGSSNFDIYAMR